MNQFEWLISVWPPSVDKYVYIIYVLVRTHNSAHGFTYQFCRHSQGRTLLDMMYQKNIIFLTMAILIYAWELGYGLAFR